MNISLSQRTLHFKKPARTSRGEYSEHGMIVITITDEKSNRIGLGECAPLPDLSCDRDAYMKMSDVARLIDNALKSDDYVEALRPYPALLFALESAMYDYQQNPILYDTPFARGEVGIPTNGLIWMGSHDEMFDQVKKKILQGFRCIKLKIGRRPLESTMPDEGTSKSDGTMSAGGMTPEDYWEEEMSVIRKIRSRFSPDTLQLRVDANGGLGFDRENNFSMALVKERLEELAGYGIHSIEQPIPALHGGSWKAMAELCETTPLPIALDEELIGVNTLAEKQTLLDTIMPQFIVVKPTLHGGISGTLEWINEANKRGIGSWMTSALESNIGLRNVALLAARVYGPGCVFPQGLGTGLLYKDNIEMDMELRGSRLWRLEVETD